MTRKLASLRIIADVQKHPNADALDIVTIDGWQCVAAIGEFKKGDVAIYFEIGSYLPVCERFEFLRKSCYKEHPDLGPGFRIKTIKLRGEIAQGLAVPLSKFSFEELPVVRSMVWDLIASDENDVTELLGVKKYEVPERNSGGVNCGRSKSSFPSFIPKTDQERIQNLFNKFSQQHKHAEWEVTMKLDGSSMTVFYEDTPVTEYLPVEVSEESIDPFQVVSITTPFNRGVCSRNMNLNLDGGGDFVNFSNESGLLDRLTQYCQVNNRSLALQGELMGPRIQKNREQFERHYFYLFDVYDIEAERYLNAAERQDVFFAITDHSLIRHAPVIDNCMAVFEEYTNIGDLLEWVNKAASINHKIAEGYVFKHLSNPAFSFKCISNLFLLRCDTED